MTARIWIALVIVSRRWNSISHSVLEFGQIHGAESVCLGHNGNEVDTRAKTLHDLDIQWLQSMTSGSDKVEASVYAKVDLLGTARLLFLKHVGLMLIVKELDDGLPGIPVVDIVAKSRGIDDGQAHWTGQLLICF